MFTAALTVVACSTDATGPSKDVSLSIKVGSPTAPAAGVRRLALTLPTGLELDRVRLILREVELESEMEDDHGSGNSGLGSDDNSRDEFEIEFGPFLVDLGPDALLGAMIENVVTIPVPAGTYDELKFKIAPIAAGADDQPALADLTYSGLSMLIEGTIDGEPFSLSSSAEVENERHVNIVVGDAGSVENLTLFIDPDMWFVDPTTGERLDPREEADRAQIIANLKQSIHAEDDDDHDGIGDDDDDDDNDDHGDHGEGHEGENEHGHDGGVDDDDGGNTDDDR